MSMDAIKNAIRWERAEGGNQSRLARKIGVLPQDITNWKKRGMPAEWWPRVADLYGKSVDELLGRSSPTDALVPAVTAQPPDGYIRLEHLSPEPSMGSGRIEAGPEQIVEYLDVLERWVREKVGSTNPARVKILTGSGNSMLPTISDGDLVFVDTTCHAIESEGIYVLDVVGRLLLKKALILSDGTLILRSDNVVEYPNEERHDLRRASETIVVCGKVLAWWALRKG